MRRSQTFFRSPWLMCRDCGGRIATQHSAPPCVLKKTGASRGKGHGGIFWELSTLCYAMCVCDLEKHGVKKMQKPTSHHHFLFCRVIRSACSPSSPHTLTQAQQHGMAGFFLQLPAFLLHFFSIWYRKFWNHIGCYLTLRLESETFSSLFSTFFRNM